MSDSTDIVADFTVLDEVVADPKATRRRALKNLVLTGAAVMAVGVAANLLQQKFGHDYSTDPDSEIQ